MAWLAVPQMIAPPATGIGVSLYQGAKSFATSTRAYARVLVPQLVNGLLRIGKSIVVLRSRSSAYALLTSSSTQSLSIDAADKMRSNLSLSRMASSIASQVLAPMGRS